MTDAKLTCQSPYGESIVSRIRHCAQGFIAGIRPAIQQLLFRAAMAMSKDNSCIQHAKRELQAAGYDLNSKEEGPNKWLASGTLDLLRVFSMQGHSGFSASYGVAIFEKLAKYQPLCPLTGNDDEWNEVGDGVFQNNRCGLVFKQKDRFDGQAYNLGGLIFREPSGCCYTSKDSLVPITFPYTPKSEYVDVPAQSPKVD